MNKEKTKKLTECALLAALIYVATLTGAVAPIGGGAYIHIGDAAVYLAVLMLPTPYAVAAAAVGAAFSDFTLGSAVYIIPTLIIKSAVVLIAKQLIKITENELFQDVLVSASGAVTVLGYYVAEAVLLMLSGSTFKAATVSAVAASVPFNLIQAGISAVIFLVAGGAVRKLLKKIEKGAASSDDSHDDMK